MTKYPTLEEDFQQLQNKINTFPSMRSPHNRILKEVDKHMVMGFAALESTMINLLSSPTHSNMTNILPVTSLTPTFPAQSQIISEDTGAIIIKPSRPLHNKDKRSFLSSIKMSLHNSGVSADHIKETKDTNQGALVLKCHIKEDIHQVEKVLTRNKEIKKLANVENRGPRLVKFIIKNLPYHVKDET